MASSSRTQRAATTGSTPPQPVSETDQQPSHPASRAGSLRRDWRTRGIEEGTTEQPEILRCPLVLHPHASESVPATNRANAWFYENGKTLVEGKEDKAQRRGHYALQPIISSSIEIYAGVWSEIERYGNDWRAARVARDELGLVQDPLPGLAMAQLRASGDSEMKKAVDAFVDAVLTERKSNTRSNRASSMTIEPQHHLCKRGAEGDDPFTIDNLQKHDPRSATGRLEGILPDRFERDRSKTLQFLTKFKRFMMMNCDAMIARNPIKRSPHFLSSIEGSKIEGWGERQYKWLDAIEADPTLLTG